MPELRINKDNEHVTVKFQDSQILDESYARTVGLKLIQVANEAGDKHLVLNFERVKFMASAMIGQLIAVRNKCKELGVQLKVCCLCPQLSEAICLMNIDKILNIYECEDSAKASKV